MRVTVHIYSFLRRHIPAAEQRTRGKEWDVPGDATVSDLVDRLKLPKEVRVTVLLNHSSVDQKTVLKEGDIIHILPQMGGG